MLGPLDQDEQLLLHGVPDVDDGGQLLARDLVFAQLLVGLVSGLALTGAHLSVEKGFHRQSWKCEQKQGIQYLYFLVDSYIC